MEIKMEEKYVFLYGLYRAGKTTLSETIKQNKTISKAKPTLAVNMDNWVIKDLTFKIWDAPGQESLLKLTWNHFKKMGLNKNAILIYLLDTADEKSFEAAKRGFIDVLNDLEGKEAALILCFHKMDLGIAKDKLKEAKRIFKLKSRKEREIFTLETSIYNLDSVLKLKEKLYSIATNLK